MTVWAGGASALELSPWGQGGARDADGRLSLGGSTPAKTILTFNGKYGSAEAGKVTLLNEVVFRVGWKMGDSSDLLIDSEKIERIVRDVKERVAQGDEHEGEGDGEGDDNEGRHHKPPKPSR